MYVHNNSEITNMIFQKKKKQHRLNGKTEQCMDSEPYRL